MAFGETNLVHVTDVKVEGGELLLNSSRALRATAASPLVPERLRVRVRRAMDPQASMVVVEDGGVTFQESLPACS